MEYKQSKYNRPLIDVKPGITLFTMNEPNEEDIKNSLSSLSGVKLRRYRKGRKFNTIALNTDSLNIGQLNQLQSAMKAKDSTIEERTLNLGAGITAETKLGFRPFARLSTLNSILSIEIPSKISTDKIISTWVKTLGTTTPSENEELVDFNIRKKEDKQIIKSEKEGKRITLVRREQRFYEMFADQLGVSYDDVVFKSSVEGLVERTSSGGF